MADLTSILSKKSEEIKAPPPIPKGHYVCFVQKYEFGKSKRQQTDYCRVYFKAVEAKDDVDQAELAAIGGLDKVEFYRDFYLTEDSVFIFNDFLKGPLGIPSSGRTLAEMCPEMPSKTCLVEIGHSPILNRDNTPTGRNRSEAVAFAAA